MLRLKPLVCCNQISRFVVNISIRNNHKWFEDDEFLLDEEPELPTRADITRMQKQNRQFVKQKIIQKKNFPMPKEAFVLTWEAMEQMRFLNKEFPEEWTLDRITESFPVSRHAAVRILKTRRSKPTEADIIKHNSIVKMNLEALKSGDVDGNELLANTLRSLTEDNRLSLLSNSGGVKGLPMPTSEQSYPNIDEELSFEEQVAQLRVRPFTSILAKYNRLIPDTSSKQQSKDAKVMLPSTTTQNKGKKRNNFDKNSKSENLQRSNSCDSSRSDYRKTSRSKSDNLPGELNFADLPRTKSSDSPKSKFDDLPRLEYGDLPRREYGSSSQVRLSNSSKSPHEDSPKSESNLSPRTEDSLRSRSHVSSRSKSHFQENLSYDDIVSELPSLRDIGSDSMESLYSKQEDDNVVNYENRSSSNKKYLSRKEKKELQKTKIQQLPSSKTWDEMALYGTGKKLGN
ncbi:uncharacterized protein LOC117334373 [Pecten maximus]|uniref:uncharacterized protein LOC117334373 n=1 Tax=Pecten maximus TaxID=6579 RepID=UPI001459018F|nr:uncharacterized protein LOC117334373 [Pecten maximus]